MKTFAALILLAAALPAQAIRTVSYNLIRLDPALDSIVTADSPLEVLGEQVNAAGQGEVLITAPSGKRLGTIQLPQIGGEPRLRICASNVAFGDADGKALYITSCTHLFRIRLKSPGLRPLH